MSATITDYPADKRAAYNRGWRYSNSATCTGLDFADSKGYSSDEAWMDGYLDAAAGRPKWSTPRRRSTVVTG